jgi:hypothetical protein
LAEILPLASSHFPKAVSTTLITFATFVRVLLPVYVAAAQG